MKYDIHEVLDMAFREKMPRIVVEGDNDRLVYTKIAEKAGKTVEIYPIEWVDGLEKERGNCGMIIQAMQQLQPKLIHFAENKKWILGIIDADARDFRPISPNFPDEGNFRSLFNLLVLKYYSVETYFANEENLKKLFAFMSYALEVEIGAEMLQFLAENHENDTEFYYYLSLEALKKANEQTYVSVDRDKISYGGKEHFDEKDKLRILPQLQAKNTDLDIFATQKSISISHLKQICKGKWYLWNYVYRAVCQADKLIKACENQPHLPKCANCEVDKSKCNYRTKQTYKSAISILYNQMLTYVNESECEDIISAMKQLG